MNIRLKKPENQLPEENKTVIIRYREKKEDPHLPYELGSGYYYNCQWYLNGFNPASFNTYYEVTGWTYYSYHYQKLQKDE